MQVYMNTWANYNEHGADGVLTPADWMSLEDAIEYFDEYAEYGPFVNDTEDIPEVFDIGEGSSADDLQRLIDINAEDIDTDILEAIMECGYSLEDALDKYESGDYQWYAGITDPTDLAYAVIEEIGSLGDALGDRINYYIDEDQMRTAYRWDVEEMLRENAEEEVEREHEGQIRRDEIPEMYEAYLSDLVDDPEDWDEDELAEAISDAIENEYGVRPVDGFDFRVDGESVVAEGFEFDPYDVYDFDDAVEQYVEDNFDSYMDSIIDEELAMAERGEIDLSDYFDYEAFGRDLAFDYTFTDAGAIRCD